MQQNSPASERGSYEPATVDLSGRCVGSSYILICPVGHGATGTVWRGMERTSGEHVAVKLLHEGMLRQPKLVTRFVQERTILMMLRHEYIVGVRDLFSAGESLGLVMDFVAGGSLREHLRREGTLPAGEAARLLAQVAAALAEAHGIGVVHRDVKPDNILLRESDGRRDVRLTDFGIARILDAPGLTTPQAIIGTPHYMAPETISGGEPTPPADVYALGVVLYELVAGRPPYAGDPMAVLRSHLDDKPVRPAGVAEELWSVISSCMDKDKDRRPSAVELADTLSGLARLLGDVPALPAPVAGADAGEDDPPRLSPPPVRPARHPSAHPGPRPRAPRNRPGTWRWRRPGALAALITVVLLSSAAAGYGVWQSGYLQAAGASSAAAPAAGPGGNPPGGRSTAGPSRMPGPVPAQPVVAGAAAASAADGRRQDSGAAQAEVSAGPAHAGVSVGPGQVDGLVRFGPYQCGDAYTWDIGHPVLAKPCHAVGSAIRVVGHIEATPGVQTDVSLSVEDAQTKDVVAGPYVCKGLMFTDFALKHTCGPVDLDAPRGRRYRVVESWEYTGRSLLPGGTARGPEFVW
ncbi:serine/threonine-protein kinase [Couchioplanes caeruleus subsp. azureus]|uniref:serine/threonine-protein kinase n=1 Tax=Couchioplanes caeruleus TaxID=56438 RepID=UPI0036085618